jgi:CRP-like cAMP-binding protein
MTNAFTRKLSRFAEFSDEEIAALERLSANPEHCERGRDLIRQGDRPDVVQLLLDGWAYRYKVLKNGRRQILGYLLPGDICDVHITLLSEMDHSIGLLTDAQVVTIPSPHLQEIMERHRKIELAIWCAVLVDEAILREWLTNMGQRDAFSRVGHHLCELWHRMKSVGLVNEDEQFDLPLTQEELGDSLGLTSVHVNRTLKRLKEDGLIALTQRRLTVLDPKRLTRVTGFDATYLHLGHSPKARMQKPRHG